MFFAIFFLAVATLVRAQEKPDATRTIVSVVTNTVFVTNTIVLVYTNGPVQVAPAAPALVTQTTNSVTITNYVTQQMTAPLAPPPGYYGNGAAVYQPPQYYDPYYYQPPVVYSRPYYYGGSYFRGGAGFSFRVGPPPIFFPSPRVNFGGGGHFQQGHSGQGGGRQRPPGGQQQHVQVGQSRGGAQGPPVNGGHGQGQQRPGGRSR